ncbi:DJ-1/PfpI family protein [Nonomuraea thailandensis]
MNVAIPLYPRFTALDAVGPYTVLAFSPGCTVTFVADRPGPVPDDHGTLTINATASYADLPAPDVIVVPGGSGTFDALSDEALVGWIRQAHEHTRWTTSVCSGSLLLGAAGVLEGCRRPRTGRCSASSRSTGPSR